jgi:hypothetical protein
MNPIILSLNELWNQSVEQAKIQSEPVIKESLLQSGLPSMIWEIAQPFINMIVRMVGL